MTTVQTLSRLEKAIASIEERNGYVLVASESESDKHVVTYDENYYATGCTCKSLTGDCYHRVACDRYFDDRRPNPFAAIKARRQQEQETRQSYVRMFYSGI